jgi:hypothetical protein
LTIDCAEYALFFWINSTPRFQAARQWGTEIIAGILAKIEAGIFTHWPETP